MKMLTHEFSKGTNNRLGQLFLFLAFLCLGYTGWTYYSDSEFIRTAHLAKGMVIKVEKKDTWPTIKFSDASGHEILFQPEVRSAFETFTAGQTVEVLYHDSAPHEARLNISSHLWGATQASALCLAVFGVLGALTLSGKLRWGPLKQSRITIGPN